MYIASDWKDYECIDCGEGMKYERWGGIHLLRPDPQVIWGYSGGKIKPDAQYRRSSSGGGQWEYYRSLPESWTVSWRELTFKVRPMGFKHTGLFPEQAANWDWMMRLISSCGRPVKVLNLFGYTGGATVAAAKAGASVCHVDAAKNMVAQCKENIALSGLSSAPVRYIVDDCAKFVQREIRRGSRYDAIIMDPPSYGRGPSGEIWKLENELYGFVKLCTGVLSEKPLFMLINSYTTGLQPIVLRNILASAVKPLFRGRVEAAEVALPVTRGDILLPCGASGRMEFD